MSEESFTPKKVHPDNEDYETLSKNELIARLRDQEQYIKQLESKRPRLDRGDDDLDSSDRLKQQQRDAARRENTLVHRLTTKEQELQDFVNQIAEVKQAQTQGTAQLRSMLLDPAVNILFQRMAKDMDEAQDKLKQTQNELSAWKFTPDSQTGKRLMARCQMLLQENEELGKTIASGRTAKLEGDIALQKTLVTEMKNNQSELDEFLGDLEEDVEGMQTMIYVLQQQLRESKEQIVALEEDNARLRAGDMSGSYKTFSNITKQREKPEPSVKVEITNHNSDPHLDETLTDYTPMETGFYHGNEKTDSDLEAEYNYEGLYENEDKYQEELEAEQATESSQYEYETNGYKHYEEEYEAETNSKDNPDSISADRKDDYEVMDTAEAEHNKLHHSQHFPVAADSTNIAVVTDKTGQMTVEADTSSASRQAAECETRQQVETTVLNEDSQKISRTSISEEGQNLTDRDGPRRTRSSKSDDQGRSIVANDSKDVQSVHSIHEGSRTRSGRRVLSRERTPETTSGNSPDSQKCNNRTPENHSTIKENTRERTPERDGIQVETTCKEKISSPKPSRLSPHIATADSVEGDTKSNRDHQHSPSSQDRSPIRARSSPNQLTDESVDRHPEAHGKIVTNNAIAADSSPDKKDKSPEINSRSPSSNAAKEREPVLQKFLNGVTSTVDDIEDL